MSEPNFKGYTVKAVGEKLSLLPFDPKPWEEDDVDVKILYCGLCGSDASAIEGEFGPITEPTICGHELVGEVTRAGAAVENNIKVGDLVGIGPEADTCRECEYCAAGQENFCPQLTMTYGLGQQWRRGKAAGKPVYGGFAKYWRGPSRFAVPIPSKLDPADAGPILCGGLTVYNPLRRYGAGDRAKKVGILGIGGLGHLAIQIAAAMGAEVTAISRGTSKKEDALKLGATSYLSTSSNLDEDFKDHKGSLDLIICTINPPTLPINEYLTLLRPYGTFVIVGAIAQPLSVSGLGMMFGATGVAGSFVGSVKELTELLDLCVKHNVKPWVQKYDFDNINEAMADYHAGKPKFRFVLVNTDNGGKL